MNLIETINNKISKRNTYGMREEIAYNRGYIISWSNACKRWNIGYYQIKKNEIINLDANQIFVEARKNDIIETLDKLNELPLYNNSYEAKLKIAN
jgi:hypothetical protein